MPAEATTGSSGTSRGTARAGSLRCPGTRGARARHGSRRDAARRHLAGRQGLPRRRERRRDGLLRSGGQVHLGARAGRAGPRLCRHRRQGRHLPRRRRRRERGLLPDADHQRDVAAAGPGRADVRVDGIARACAAHRAVGQGLRPARFAVPRGPRAPRRRRGNDLRRRGERQAWRPGVGARRRRPRNRPATSRWRLSRRRSWP